MRDQIRRQARFQTEILNHRKDGSGYWASIEVQPLLDGRGQVTHWMSVQRDITSLRQAERALRDQAASLEQRVAARTLELEQSRQQFEDLIELAPDAFVLADSDGRIQLVNREAERLFGWKRDELIGRSVDLLVPAELRAHHAESRQAYVADGTPLDLAHRGALRALRKDGSEFPAEIALGRLNTPRGPLVTAVIRDISFRIQAEKAIRDTEALYQHAADYLEGIHPEDRPAVINALERQSKGEPTVAEYRVVTPDGTLRWILDRSFPVPGPDGRPFRSAGVARDITQRRQAEEDLRIFRTIADGANYGVAIAALTGHIQYVNETWAREHGWKVGELLGRKLTMFHRNEDLPRVQKLVQRIIEEGGFAAEEVWHLRQDGSTYPTLMSCARIDDNAQLLRSTSAVLRAHQHDAVTAENGAEALKRTDLDSFQLVITDVLMPEKEGFETIMTLRRLHPAVKIIAVSGGGYIDAKQYLESAQMLGAHLTLEKPFSGLDLMLAIDKVLGTPAKG